MMTIVITIRIKASKRNFSKLSILKFMKSFSVKKSSLLQSLKQCENDSLTVWSAFLYWKFECFEYAPFMNVRLINSISASIYQNSLHIFQSYRIRITYSRLRTSPSISSSPTLNRFLTQTSKRRWACFNPQLLVKIDWDFFSLHLGSELEKSWNLFWPHFYKLSL